MKGLDCLNRLATEYIADRLQQLSKPLRNYWGQRCVLQLQYAVRLSENCDGRHDSLIEKAVKAAWDDFTGQGALNKKSCQAVESLLQPLAEDAKSKSLICVGHAHIDMNWMWSYDETAAITLDTLRTMLDLMQEYPGFTFAQSQAAVYDIVARHAPEMLPEIRQRIKGGQWEVTASTWVEADRNMPNAESMARHFLYTRQYLADLLQIDPASLDLDFEPDTFGHHQNVPEILSDAGVRYYYHCRGSDEPSLHRWQAPSGRSILVFHEPLFYNLNIDGQCAMILPKFCKEQGMDVMLRVYGVGDHGGGPTRRDIEKIIDMDTWPIFPRYKFGTYHDFFTAVEKIKDRLPVVTHELNFIFTGCYTTQTRIKKGNRLSEARLFEAESACTLARFMLDKPYPVSDFHQAWRHVMFNQFHDILPGSGKVETREYAMGLYQSTFALINSQYQAALRAISDAVDTSNLAISENEVNQEARFSRSEGAGVGFPTAFGQLSRTSRHAGLRRIYMVWNALPFDREENCELTIWDWPGNIEHMQFCDGHGNCVPHQLMTSGFNHYWGHSYQTALVRVKVPAVGYQTLVLDEQTREQSDDPLQKSDLEQNWNGILENELIRLALSPLTGEIVSIYDKESGQDLVSAEQPVGCFRLIEEDPARGMTAWIMGNYKKITKLNQDIRYLDRKDGPLQQSVTWHTAFGNGSRLQVTVALNKGERQVRLAVKVNWQEIGSADRGVPQLNFLIPLHDRCDSFRYDLPMGYIDRGIKEFDVPASSFAAAINPDGRALMLISDSKYGFRGSTAGLSLTLIRSSFDPDPWPEVGEHEINLAIALSDGEPLAACKTSQTFCHPMHVVAATAPHPGQLPLAQSLLSILEGAVILSGVKLSEDGSSLVIRMYSISTDDTRVRLRLWQEPVKARFVNLHESEITDRQINVKGHELQMTINPCSIKTIEVFFRKGIL